MPQSLLSLLAAAHLHAKTEAEGGLEDIMTTMEGEPIYEFHPIGLAFQGMEETRRYYQYFIDEVRPRMKGYQMISESFGSCGVMQEYDLDIQLVGDDVTSKKRIAAMLVFGEQGLTGERMYGDSDLFKTMFGPLWDELVPLSDLKSAK